MSFKIGDIVISVLNGEDTDQIGIVIEVDEHDVTVSPVDYSWATFCYDLEGKHREDTKFSIRKQTKE